MYKRILVPLDGSELAECALRHVKAIATGCNVPEVVLLRVIEPISSYALAVSGSASYALAGASANAMTAQLLEDEKGRGTLAKQYVDKKADELKKEGIAARPALVSGQPANEILDYATKNQVDLIIMSTHGRSGISRWAFGSVADRVVRTSTTPVLTVSPPGCRITQQ